MPSIRSVALTLALCAAAGCAGEPVGSDDEAATDAGALGPVPQGVPTRHPIVLAHGFDASPDNRWGFRGVAEALRADGHRVYVAIVPPYQSPAARAAYLADHVEAALADGAERVNIVAHSMGGLDARVLVSALGYGDVVASVTTISTAHHGSAVADAALAVIDGLGVDGKLLDALGTLWGLGFNELAHDTNVRAALEGLSEAAAPAFNAAHGDDPRVYYQSWAGVSSVGGIRNPRDWSACEDRVLGGRPKADKMHASLVPMAAFVAHGVKLDPNDGMVRVASAKWGDFRGCIPADHLDQVGYEAKGPDARTRFSHIRFYRNLAFELADGGY
jgi:triacylglycerol lipase